MLLDNFDRECHVSLNHSTKLVVKWLSIKFWQYCYEGDKSTKLFLKFCRAILNNFRRGATPPVLLVSANNRNSNRAVN